MWMPPSWPIRMVISVQDSPCADADSAASRMFCACSANLLTLPLSLRIREILGIYPDEPLGYHGGLRLALDFDRHSPGDLDSALEIFN